MKCVFSLVVVSILIVVFSALGFLAEPDSFVSTPDLNSVSWHPSDDPVPTQLEEVGHSSFLSPHVSPIAIYGGQVFVVNTPSGTVDVIDVDTREIVKRIPVGIEPVSIAIRPDGKEAWVANHVSDSVSVIDSDVESVTHLHVIATVQDIDLNSKETRFDEPVGIAFANNEKAYVALSSENKIAVVDVASRQVKKRIHIPAQDPRAITVRDGKLYVIPFESNNRTQLSGGRKDDIDGDLVTFDAWEHSVVHNNVLSLGHVVDIVKHPEVPDRDLFVFDTKTDKLIETVETLGTLLYGLTVDSKGKVFIAQTDARNEINGRAGTKHHGLKELENRAFLNQISVIDFESTVSAGKESDKNAKRVRQFFDLEPLPPKHPDPQDALATPFAIEISDDDSTLVVSAASSDKIFTIDSESGQVLGQVVVDSVPRGIALSSNDERQLHRAWVLNAVANTVSLIDVSDKADLKVLKTIELHDPTDEEFKRGRIAFNTASASTTGTFSCASCHPDGHTDQLLWVLKTPIVSGGDQIMPRSTMPLRGLRDTAPFHWDGIPGDPYGGNNSQKIHGEVEPNSSIDSPESMTRHVIDGSLASTMAMVSHPESVNENDEGKSGELSASQRDDMAKFLLSIPFPPAQRRAYTNVVSQEARRGFELFHIKGDNDEKVKPNVCGDCHRMPFLVSTNTPGTGMDAPTWRGAYDRWLILPQGRLNIVEFDFYRRVAERGLDERSIWQFSWAGRRRFDPVWRMVVEGSTGYSGAFARQVTLNEATANGELTMDMLEALELNAKENGVILQVDAVLTDGETSSITLQYDAEKESYVVGDTKTLKSNINTSTKPFRQSYNRDELIELALNERFVGTFTARLGGNVSTKTSQPAIWTMGPIEAQRGRQEFPILHAGKLNMRVSGRHIKEGAYVIVDGRRVEGSVGLNDDETVDISLETKLRHGIHFVQLQNPGGLFSNEFIVHSVKDEAAAKELNTRLDREYNPLGALAKAIDGNDLKLVKEIVSKGAKINRRDPASGTTPLVSAAVQNRVEIAKYLIENGARVSIANRDGNTPLHVASFFCYFEFTQLLIDNNVELARKNNDGSTSLSSVSSDWSKSTEDIYKYFNNILNLDLDLDRLKVDRPKMAKLLREALKAKQKKRKKKAATN